MASYASPTDVQDEIKGANFAASGAIITTSKVQSLCDQATAYMNAKLGMRYQLPLAGTDALALMKMLCIWLVKERVAPILKVSTSGGKESQGESRETLGKEARDMLEKIVSGEIDLVSLGAQLKSSSDGVTSGNVENGVAPTMDKDRTQW